MKRLLTLSLLMLAGCGENTSLPLHPFSLEARESFVREANARGFDLKLSDVPNIRIDKTLPRDIEGYCSHGVVTVGPSHIADGDLAVVEAVAFHEFGHCVLGLDHVLAKGFLMSPQLNEMILMDDAKRASVLDTFFEAAR